MEQTVSKLGKEYVMAIYWHPAYLTYIQSASCETSGWMRHKVGSRLLGEISITSDMQMTPDIWQKKNHKSLLVKVRKASQKVGSKLNFQKTKIMASDPIISWQIGGETMERLINFILGGSKILQMVTAAMKLKDACSLEDKLWAT